MDFPSPSATYTAHVMQSQVEAAFHRAVEANDLQEVTELLAGGARPDRLVGDWTPLHRAAAKGYVEIARVLLEAGAAVDMQGAGGWTPLHRAAKLGHEEMTMLLLEWGADVHAQGIQGWTPLLRAAMAGQATTGRLLIAAGADIQANNAAQRWTPLHWAAFSGSMDLARDLIAAGAEVGAAAGTGATPLRLAVHYGHDDMVEFLREQTGDAQAEDQDG